MFCLSCGNNSFSVIDILLGVLLFLFVGLSIGFVGSGLAATVVVDDSGDEDFVEIQSAVNNSEDRDTIIVQPGIYNESLDVDKNISIVGSGSNTVLDGENILTGNTAVEIGRSSRVNISDLRLENYTVGIEASNTTNSWKLQNLDIVDSFFGVNATQSNGEWKIEDSKLKNNFWSIFASNSTNNWMITDVKIQNTAAGLILDGSEDRWTIKDTEITDSQIGLSPTRTSGDWTITNTTIKDLQGAGIIVAQSSGDWAIQNSTLRNISKGPPSLTTNPRINGTAVFANETSGQWSIQNTVITGSSNFGVNAENAQVQGDATQNWWGQQSGPTQNQCVGNVDCSNWLENPPQGQQSVINLYDLDGDGNIEGDEVRQAISCFLFGSNNLCVDNNELSGEHIRQIIQEFLFG